MVGSLLYLDSSALVKLVLNEPETEALRKALSAWPERVSSDLASVEVMRAVVREKQEGDSMVRARQMLAGLHLVSISREIVAEAGILRPRSLRPLDAIHLASALSLRTSLGALAVYDRTLARAARSLGLRVLAPA